MWPHRKNACPNWASSPFSLRTYLPRRLSSTQNKLKPTLRAMKGTVSFDIRLSFAVAVLFIFRKLIDVLSSLVADDVRHCSKGFLACDWMLMLLFFDAVGCKKWAGNLKLLLGKNFFFGFISVFTSCLKVFGAWDK